MAKLKSESDQQRSILEGSVYFSLSVLVPTVNTLAVFIADRTYRLAASETEAELYLLPLVAGQVAVALRLGWFVTAHRGNNAQTRRLGAVVA